MSIFSKSIRIYGFYVRLQSKIFTFFASKSFKSFGEKSTIQLPVRIWGESKTVIGKNVFIGPGCCLLALDGEAGESGKIKIGDRCSFTGDLTITSHLEVVIEDDVLMGRNIHISDHAHKFSEVQTPIKNQGNTKPELVKIGRGVWLGQGVVVCPGVKIGEYSVIGANSVVTKDVPRNSLAVGTPAKVIRKIGVKE